MKDVNNVLAQFSTRIQEAYHQMEEGKYKEQVIDDLQEMLNSLAELKRMSKEELEDLDPHYSELTMQMILDYIHEELDDEACLAGAVRRTIISIE